MIQVWIFSLAALLVVFGAQILRPSSLLAVARVVLILSVFFILLLPAYYSYQQFFLWKAHPVSQFLLPPHQGIGYFISYSFSNFFLNPIISIAVALFGFLAAKKLNEKFNKRFFKKEEYCLLANGLLLTGASGWIYYLLLLFSAGIIGYFFNKEIISFYYFWSPAGILVIIYLWFVFPILN